MSTSAVLKREFDKATGVAVQRVVPAATLLENATALAAEIGKGSPAAVRN